MCWVSGWHALLSRNIGVSVPGLGFVAAEGGAGRRWQRPLGLAHAVVLIRSCNFAGAGLVCPSKIFVIVPHGVESGVAAVVDRFCPVRQCQLVIHTYWWLLLSFMTPPPLLFGPIHRWLQRTAEMIMVLQSQ